jgi:hypothetical protein
MIGSSAAFRQRETELWARFNLRTHVVAVAALYLQLTLVVAHLMAGASMTFSLLNLLMALSALFVAAIETDTLVFFLATNANWVFSFSAYVYSSSEFRLVDDKLWGPGVSMGLAFVFHLGCLSAYAIFRLLWRRRTTADRPLRAYERALLLMPHKDGLLILGIALQALNTALESTTLSAIASQFSALLWLGLAFHFMGKGRFAFDLKSAAFLAIVIVISARSNSRTTLVLAVFFIALSWLYYADRVVKLRYFVAFYFGLSFLNLFSDIALDLRLNQRALGENRSVANVMAKLIDIDSLEAVLNPFHMSKSAINMQQTSYVLNINNRFVTPYYSGLDSLASRNVALPLLDSVCGRYGDVERVKWQAIGGMLLALLPNVGQEKDLIYSDRLTWDLGLRDYGNVGRPEVTNACEIYTMVGWIGLFFVTLAEFLLTFVLLEVLKRRLVAPALWIAVVPQIVVWLTVSTTALASLAAIVRGIPITIATVWLLYALTGRTWGHRVVARPRSAGDGSDAGTPAPHARYGANAEA